MSLDISRRSLLGGIITLGMAPAIVRVSSIMPVKPLPRFLETGLDINTWGPPLGTVQFWLSDFGLIEIYPHDTYETVARKAELLKQQYLGAA